MTRTTKLFSIACIILLLPLLYINVKSYHDWGDDFAQYLLQARNIVEIKPQTNNGLVFDKVDGDFALHAYPAGFPVILSPIYYFFHLSIKPYLLLISLFMIGLGWLLFTYFNKYFSRPISLIVVVFIIYNPYLLILKDSILSDIPFVFFIFLLIRLVEQKKNSTFFYIICGILASWITSIRFIGISAIAGLIADILLHDTSKENELNFSIFARKRIRSAVIVILSAISFFFLFNIVLFHVGINDFLGFYSNSFDKESSGLFVNIKYYFDVLGAIFRFPGSQYSLPAWWVFFAFAGWIINLKKKAGFTEWFFIIYLLIILLFNRHTGGFRFIFPVFPLLIKYTIDFLFLLFNSLKKIARESIVAVLILYLMLGYIEPLRSIVKDQKRIHDGPNTQTGSELLNVVHGKIPKNEVIGFAKALTISLYTDHRATYLMTGQTPEQVEAMFLRLQVNYLIISKRKTYDTDIYDPRLDAYEEKFGNLYGIFWENADYAILQRSTKI